MMIAKGLLIVVLGLLESWLQPWLSIAGVPLPLTLIGLAVIQPSVGSSAMPWLGLAGGLALDLSSYNNFGVNSLYYLIIAWLSALAPARIQPLVSMKGWARAGLFTVAALIQPWYVLLANRQLDIDWLGAASTSLVRAACLAIVVVLLNWFIGRSEAVKI